MKQRGLNGSTQTPSINVPGIELRDFIRCETSSKEAENARRSTRVVGLVKQIVLTSSSIAKPRPRRGHATTWRHYFISKTRIKGQGEKPGAREKPRSVLGQAQVGTPHGEQLLGFRARNET